jgi:adenosylhomocysteine nucleosidase
VTVLAVTGLRAEARIAAAAGLVPVCAGGAPERTAKALDRALATGVTGIVSLGIAGGLAVGLRPGAVILPRAICGPDGARHPVSSDWHSSLQARLGAHEGDIFGATAIVVRAAEKAELHRRTGAVATDLESLVVAQAAMHAGLPFIALRVIADPAERDLPAAALLSLKPDGSADLLRILASLLVRPGQLPQLLGLALEARRALRALARAVTMVRPLLRHHEVA